MSTLSDPQSRQDALWALLRFLGEQPQPVEPEKVFSWMAPIMLLPSASGERKDDFKKRVRNLRALGERLGFIQTDGWHLVRPVPGRREEFLDQLHDAVRRSPSEAELLDIYAAMVVLVESKGSAWLGENPWNPLRDVLARPDVQGKTIFFNDTQWPVWVDWMTALGLGMPGPTGIARFIPHPVHRLARVAKTIPELAEGQEMPAPAFIYKLGQAMPYLDGGELWLDAWKRAGQTATREASIVLSNALRELHRRRILILGYEGGDRPEARRLAPGRPEPPSFASVRLGEEAPV